PDPAAPPWRAGGVSVRSPVRCRLRTVRHGHARGPRGGNEPYRSLSPQRSFHGDGLVTDAGVGVEKQAASPPRASGPLLEVRDLVTQYPITRGIVGWLTRKPKQVAHAVEGVSFSVAQGEMLALVGESGCGKTTTAQTVMRLVEPQSGSITFKGRDITSLSHQEMRPLRRRMQLIYQDPYDSLDPRFRVREAVEEPLLVHDLGSRPERRERVVRALDRAGLSPADLFLD